MMQHKHALELLEMIRHEIECGRGASGFDYTRAAKYAAQLSALLRRQE